MDKKKKKKKKKNKSAYSNAHSLEGGVGVLLLGLPILDDLLG
jgi:hypothetical protein